MAQFSDNKYKKAATKPRGTRASENVTQMNVAQQGKQDQDAVKYNYLTSIGALGNNPNNDAKGMGKDAIGGKYGNEQPWSASIQDGQTFLNFTPMQAQEAKKEVPSGFVPFETEEIEEPVYEDVNVMGKRDIFEDQPLIDISNQFNFDLGDAADGTTYDQWISQMKPEQQQRWNDYLKQIQDPEALAQVGKFQFQSGTDATPMSPESMTKWKDRFENDMDLRAWAYNEGIDLENIDNKAAQHGLGYDRFDRMKNFTSEGLRQSNSNLNFDDIFDGYGVKDHTLGKRKHNRDERFSKVTTKNKVDKITKKVGEEEFVERTDKVRKATKKITRNKRTGEKIYEKEEPYNAK